MSSVTLKSGKQGGTFAERLKLFENVTSGVLQFSRELKELEGHQSEITRLKAEVAKKDDLLIEKDTLLLQKDEQVNRKKIANEELAENFTAKAAQWRAEKADLE